MAVDPITFEVIRSALVAITNEMSLLVAKSAYSPVVNEGRDFASTVYNARGELLSQGEFDLPAFVGLQMLTVPEVMRQIGKDNMKPGDAYVINDPYVCSTHCNDVHMVSPVFHNGTIVAFVSCTAHWTDVGGVASGSLNGRATSHFEEGMRIPAVRIAIEGELNRDVLPLFLANMRDSHERVGDIKAQLSALKAGNRRVLSLIDRYGLETFFAAADEILNYSEKLSASQFAALPDGVYHSEDVIDQDPGTGLVKTVRLDLTISGSRATFDLRKTDDKALMGINCSIAATTSAVFIGLAGVLDKMPMNAGIMRTVSILTTPGSLVHALPPSPVSGCAATSMECVIACVMKALSFAAMEKGCASPFSIINSVFAGYDEKSGKDFINYVWQFGGLGATKDSDGASVVGSGYSASTQNIPVEILERRYPCFWIKQMFLDGSGGPGKKRGGLGCDMKMEFPTENTLSCIGNRERYGPPGIFGGEAGATSGLVLNRGTRRENNVGIFCLNAKCVKGDQLDYWSSGGGGYGDPLERETSAVVEDIKDDFISIQQAKAQYGVVVIERDRRRLIYDVDEAATEKLRAKLRAEREKAAEKAKAAAEKPTPAKRTRSSAVADGESPAKRSRSAQ